MINFALALWLGSLARRRRAQAPCSGSGSSLNLCVLAAFKYYNFFAASLMNAASRLRLERSTSAFFEVGLPIAISFLTFHALSYIIDVYRL